MGLSSFKEQILSQPASFKKKKDYTLQSELGRGAFGKVVRATWHKAPPPGDAQREVALKIIPKKLVKGHEDDVLGEMDVIKNLDHPNIVHCWDFFESREKFYLVFELAVGGELFDRITSLGRFTEKDAVKVIHSILSAVSYLHSKEIVHRDLKPENIIYRTKEERSDIVIADFGIAKHLEDVRAEGVEVDEQLTTAAGSVGYAAPEILGGKGHGKPVDLWSIGVIAFTVLCGYSPFRSEDMNDLRREMERAKPQFHERYWKNISPQAIDFIQSLLKADPKQRLTADQALQHPWLAPGDHATDHDLTPNLKENSVATAKTRWQSAYLKVNASQRFKNASTNGATTPLSEDSEEEHYHTAEEDEEHPMNMRAARPAPSPPVQGAAAGDPDVADVGKRVEEIKISE